MGSTGTTDVRDPFFRLMLGSYHILKKTFRVDVKNDGGLSWLLSIDIYIGSSSKVVTEVELASVYPLHTVHDSSIGLQSLNLLELLHLFPDGINSLLVPTFALLHYNRRNRRQVRHIGLYHFYF